MYLVADDPLIGNNGRLSPEYPADPYIGNLPIINGNEADAPGNRDRKPRPVYVKPETTEKKLEEEISKRTILYVVIGLSIIGIIFFIHRN